MGGPPPFPPGTDPAGAAVGTGGTVEAGDATGSVVVVVVVVVDVVVTGSVQPHAAARSWRTIVGSNPTG
jgi:hypothetical protein